MKYCLALLTALVSVADAQIMPNVNLYTTYTDNLFLSSTQRGDVVNASYVDLDYVVNEDLGLYYSGSASLFSENTDLFSHLHTFGLSYARPLRTDDLLVAGLETRLRLDRPLYDYRDFAEGRAFATLKSYLRPDLLGRIGYTCTTRISSTPTTSVISNKASMRNSPMSCRHALHCNSVANWASNPIHKRAGLILSSIFPPDRTKTATYYKGSAGSKPPSP